MNMEFVRAVSKVSSSSRGPVKKLSQSDLDGWDLCSVKLRSYQLDGLSLAMASPETLEWPWLHTQ